jgi:hypothetical protein
LPDRLHNFNFSVSTENKNAGPRPKSSALKDAIITGNANLNYL